MKKMNNKKGFTIVELVIVIAIIAILAAVLIPTFSNVIEKSRASAALQAGKSKFEELYALDYADGKIDGKENNTSFMGSDNKVTKDGFTTCTYTFADNKVTGFTYADTNGYTATYSPTADPTWTAAETPAA